ncbi:hypothetical protein FNN87_27455 [Salmonella enterica subsp. diarizonae]|nr:hypothetical protein [Salmonella enterica subsp. diarizonae]ECF5952197.1 hypothetical protein [Salmonella enterica subsp. diarizonae]
MWKVISTKLFDQWFDEQDFELKEDMLAAFQLLREFRPNLGRPHVDPERKAVVLCVGDKRELWRR